MRKVAFIFVNMPVGGAEDFALGVARHLAPEFEAHFVCLRELGKLGEEAKAAGLPVHLVPVYASRRINPFAFGKLARWLREKDISLVHSQNHHAHVFATRAARRIGIPAIVHQQKTVQDLRWRRRMQLRGSLHRAGRVLVLSDNMAKDMTENFHVPKEKLCVIPNAIDADVFRPVDNRHEIRRGLDLPEDGILLGTAARLHPHKNHAVIIESLRLLKERGVPAHAVFLGDGGLREELERKVVERGVSERVIFAGRQRPIAPWLQSLDLFVLPSIWEGQPLALLQALSCGVPVLASAIEGNLAVLGTGHPGLFEPHDSEKLSAMIEEYSAGGGIGDALRQYQRGIKVPTCENVAKSLKSVYQSLIG